MPSNKIPQLSNLWPVKVEFEGIIYDSIEHAINAAKALNPEDRIHIENACTPLYARIFGRYIEIRGDWDTAEPVLMKSMLISKFEYDGLRDLLLATKDEDLGDPILMEVRQYYKDNLNIPKKPVIIAPNKDASPLS